MHCKTVKRTLTAFLMTMVFVASSVAIVHAKNLIVNHVITVNQPLDGGTITPKGTVTVRDGKNRQFTITARPGYHVASIVTDAGDVTNSPDTVKPSSKVYRYTFRNVTTDTHIITATFAKDTFKLTVNITGIGGASGTVEADGLKCDGATCSGTYEYGTPVTLTESAGANSAIKSWTGCRADSSKKTCSVTVNKKTAVTVRFKTVTTTASVSSITISPSSASIAVGDTQQFTAVAKNVAGAVLSGVSFNWSSSDTSVATVGSNGLATGVSSGSTSIRAASGIVKSNSAALTVTQAVTTAQGTRLAITSATPAAATRDAAYSFQFEATGGTAPYTWSMQITSPDSTGTVFDSTTNNTGTNGLSIDPSTGLLSGTPLYAGSMPLRITVRDADLRKASIQYDFVVGGSGTTAAQITNAPNSGTQGNPYGIFTFSTTWTNVLGCSPNLTYLYGTIPPGLALNTLTGQLDYGTPQVAGTYNFTVSATDSSSLCPPYTYAKSDAKTYAVTISPAAAPVTQAGTSNWVKHNAPVLSPSSSGWDSYVVSSPSVVKVGANYYMYYEGESSSDHKRAIGLATSQDGVTWTKSGSAPVLAPGPSGAWDSFEVRYPAVYYDGAKFYMWYWGWNGSDTYLDYAAIGLATSTDGMTWAKYGSNPVLGSSYEQYIPGAVTYSPPTFAMWYMNNGSIGRADSTDGINWTDKGKVIDAFNVHFDGAAQRPSVINDGGTYRMWLNQVIAGGYADTGSNYRSSMIYASSTDGTTWNLFTYNNTSAAYCYTCSTSFEYVVSVLALGLEGAWDRPGVGQPAVIKDGGVYKMWYTGGRINVSGSSGSGTLENVEGSIGYATAQ